MLTPSSRTVERAARAWAAELVRYHEEVLRNGYGEINFPDFGYLQAVDREVSAGFTRFAARDFARAAPDVKRDMYPTFSALGIVQEMRLDADGPTLPSWGPVAALGSWVAKAKKVFTGIVETHKEKLAEILALPGIDVVSRAAEALTKSIAHAARAAEDSAFGYGSKVLAVRALQARYEGFVWVTKGDSKVRMSHALAEGRFFPWEGHPTEGLPGEPPGCRCSARPAWRRQEA